MRVIILMMVLMGAVWGLGKMEAAKTVVDGQTPPVVITPLDPPPGGWHDGNYVPEYPILPN